MAERRALIEGLKTSPQANPEQEEAFVYGQPKKPVSIEPALTPTPRKIIRVQLSTKMRSDLATALKRASLERQISGEEPSKLQDILEQAIEPWLQTHGYLS